VAMERQAISRADRTRPDTGRLTSGKVFVDSRSAAVTLRKLSDAMHDSPRIAAQRRLSEAMHASPRVVAQRKTIGEHLLRVVQRQEISEEEALQALQGRAPAFYEAPHAIIKPWGEEGGSNCHGYTVTGGVDEFIDGGDLLANIGDIAAVVFVRNGVIAHSGRPGEGGTLTHLLIGVGVLTSTIGDSAMGYDGRYTLPGQRGDLEEYLQPEINRRNAEEQVGTMVSAIYRALNLELPGAEPLSERIFFLQDHPETNQREQIVFDFDQFAQLHPQILIEPEDSSGSDSE